MPTRTVLATDGAQAQAVNTRTQWDSFLFLNDVDKSSIWVENILE